MTVQKHSFVYRRNRPDLQEEPGRPGPDRLLNIEQVRARLNCSRSHIYNLIQSGDLEAVTLGNSKGKRVYESEVDRYLQSRREAEGA